MNTTKSMPRQSEMIPTIFLHGFSGEGNGLKAFADLYTGGQAICINMPGFGGTKAPHEGKSQDIREYCRDVWAEIRKAVPAGPVNLVGHSHGCMIGFVLAIQHPKEVARLDLFCPVVRPRFIPRLSINFIRFLRFIRLPAAITIRLVAHPLLVGLVTRYTFHPDWSAEDRRRIVEMRERESRYYSPIMFDLMQQTLQFKKLMNNSYCAVPTRMCHVSDENVAGPHDWNWYQGHANITKIQEISGGHLCVVANPVRVVALFGRERD